MKTLKLELTMFLFYNILPPSMIVTNEVSELCENKISTGHQCHYCNNNVDAEKWLQQKLREAVGGSDLDYPRGSLRVVFNNVNNVSNSPAQAEMTLTWLCSAASQHIFYCMDCGYCSPSVDTDKCNIKFFDSLDSCTLCYDTGARHMGIPFSFVDILTTKCYHTRVSDEGDQYILADYSDLGNSNCIYEKFALPGSRFSFPEGPC